MAWTQGPRGMFSNLPPAEQLPESVAKDVTRFEDFKNQAAESAGKAFELRQQREIVRSEYEAKIGEAMFAGRKALPVDPMPDYDQSIASLESRAAGAERAAAQVYAQIGDRLIASKGELLDRTADALDLSVDEALQALTVIKPLLDRVGADVALYRWVQWIDPQAHSYAPGSAERTEIDEAFGRMLGVLRRTAYELAERRERIKAAEQIDVEEPELEAVT